MHLLILLGIVTEGVLSASLPQYQPPSSLQPFYKISPLAFDPRPVQDPKRMYTYAEVNTPYYQYHYYSPVYKNSHQQYPLSTEPSVRNEDNSNANGVFTTVRNLFFPATTTNPINSGFQNIGYNPGYKLSMLPFENRPEVYITSKPLTVNNAFAPVLRTYQPPVSNSVNPPLVAPVSTPTELATGFPNIHRETNGNDRSPAETPLIYDSTYKPDLIASSTASPNIGFKPIMVPESLANPSPTIIKGEVRRGISPSLVFRDQLSSPSSKQSFLEKSPLNISISTSTLSSQFSLPLHNSSVSDTSRISANILRVFSSPNLEFTQSNASNASFVIPQNPVIDNVFKVANFSDLLTKSTPTFSTQISTDTTVSHRQKIAKKIIPTVVPKKFLPKHPNVLFYSPGHDTPK